MKKTPKGNRLALAAVLVIVGPAAADAFDLNLDVQTRVTQTEYIQNEVKDVLAGQQPLKRTETFERITLKCKERAEDVQFVFEDRLVLWPDQTPIGNTVDNAYVSLEQGSLVLYFGKQRIKWGTGYFWNPVDVLQTPKDVFDLSESLEGITALRCEYSHPWVTPSLIVAFKPDENEPAAAGSYEFALQLYKLIGTLDVFVNAVYWHQHVQSLGCAVSWDADWFILNAEVGAVKCLNDHLNLKRTLTRNAESIPCSYLAGVSRNIGEEWFVNAEYYHRGDGLDNAEFEAYLREVRQEPAWLKYLAFAMKRDYAALGLDYTWENAWQIDLVAIKGLNDGTSYFYPRVRYIENANWNIELGYLKNYATPINQEGYYLTPVQYAVELRLTGYF